MGRKQPWKGKYIYLYIAGLTFLFLFDLGCATFVDRKPLLYSQMLIDRGDFEGALEENRKVLSSYSNRPPGDEALFNMGLIYAHYGNPQKDYEKAFSFFWRLIKEFPQSPLYQEAKIWAGVLNAIDETKTKTEERRSTYDRLLRSQRLVAKGDFEAALEENRKVLSSYSNRPPGDEALFNMGLIYAHYGNPQKDYEKAIFFFRKLLNEQPKSPLGEQAKIWIGILNVIEKSKHVDIEIEKMKKELSR
jgi:tetratricopeptide (TPR) repeat protein